MDTNIDTTIEKRYEMLDSLRQAKMLRARECASLTVPSLLPPSGTSQQDDLPMPFSSMGARGVTSMAARMLSAMLPLNDDPFFKFEKADGSMTDLDSQMYLEALSRQVHTTLSSNNLRDTLFLALQHLIVTGDCLLVMEDDYSFSVRRLDQYVVRRTATGKPVEVILVQYELDDEADISFSQNFSADPRSFNHGGGMIPTFIRLSHCGCDSKPWQYEKEVNGEIVESAEYSVLPYIPLRWSGITGEDYGRSYCEELAGDLRSLEAFTEAHIEASAAASRFNIAISPSGMTDIEDVIDAENGEYIAARAEDVFVMSPSETMKPQLDATSRSVAEMRQAVAQAFLMNAGVRQAERVTATEIRQAAQELENVLGGAFSAISRDLMEPLIKRAFFLLVSEEKVDPRLAEQFSEGGILATKIVTGLQALSRDQDLEKLMRLGEMTRNLPPQAQERFKWEAYATALVSALGMKVDNWIVSDEEIQQQQQQQAQMQMQQQAAQAAMQGAQPAIEQAAMQDMQATGGEGIAEAAQQMGVLHQ